VEILFIVNPIAGKDKAISEIPLIEEQMRNTNISYKIIKTTRPKEATQIAIEGLKTGFDTIVAVGGDGTINEIVAGIVSVGTGTLGIIPGGTGNDLARTLDIPMDANEAISLILNREVKSVDVGYADNRLFINVASVGLDAEIARNTEAIKKYIKGKFAYTAGLFKTLVTYRRKKMKIYLDQGEIEREALLIAVGGGVLEAILYLKSRG